MFRNFVKSALRALVKYKGTTAINILGLTIGLSASILIFIYVFNETSYDRFHEKADRTYRIGVIGKMMGNDLNMAVTSSVMAPVLLEEYPEVESITRIWRGGSQVVRYEDQSYQEEGNDILFVDSTFFDVFSFKLLQGDPNEVLTMPKGVVITKNTATKFFGKENPIGKGLTVNTFDNIYTVTGVVEDPPLNSHFHFKYLVPITNVGYLARDNWLSHNFYTYVVLKPGIGQDHFTQNLAGLLEKYIGPLLSQMINVNLDDFLAQGNTFEYITTPLTKIHLDSHQQYEIEPTGNRSYVLIFAGLAILILVVASINFINLATARSAYRSMEVGVRKIMGSTRQSRIVQFLIESSLLSILSLIIAIVLVYLLLPSYNTMINSSLVFNPLTDIPLLLSLLGLGLFVGLLSGFYPALALASTKPVTVINRSKGGSGGKGRLRKTLVVLQFTVTLIILTCTITAYRQLNFMQEKELGFDKENVLVVNSGHFLEDQYNAFRDELLAQTAIHEVARSSHLPGMIFSNNAHFLEGRGVDEIYTIMQAASSPEWADVIGLEIVEGRYFDLGRPADSAAVVINQATARELQITNIDTVRFWFPPAEGREAVYFPIIGIVKDFHFESMQQPIGPAIIYQIGGESYGFISIKTKGDDNGQAMRLVEETWMKFAPNYPIEAFWLDDFFDEIFSAEARTSRILLVFSILSILISCLGLLGMISFTTVQRTKEIAIRKTYGSSIWQVVLLLFKETWILLAISTALALPSFFLISNWMNNFAYKISFNAVSFGITLVLVALVTLVLAALTVSQEATRAARTNPAEAFQV